MTRIIPRWASIISLIIILDTNPTQSSTGLGHISPCARNCLESGLSATNCSAATDLKCLCANPGFKFATTLCLKESCDKEDLAQAEQFLSICVITSPTPSKTSDPCPEPSSVPNADGCVVQDGPTTVSVTPAAAPSVMVVSVPYVVSPTIVTVPSYPYGTPLPAAPTISTNTTNDPNKTTSTITKNGTDNLKNGTTSFKNITSSTNPPKSSSGALSIRINPYLVTGLNLLIKTPVTFIPCLGMVLLGLA